MKIFNFFCKFLNFKPNGVQTGHFVKITPEVVKKENVRIGKKGIPLITGSSLDNRELEKKMNVLENDEQVLLKTIANLGAELKKDSNGTNVSVDFTFLRKGSCIFLIVREGGS